MTTRAAIPVPATASATSRPSAGLRGFAWGVVAYNVLVIVWGAAVRATGSGAGCGDHWPLCNGNVVLHHPGVATLIEFAHRASSGVALLAVIALTFWIFRTTPRYHAARFWSMASLLLTLNEALLGALLVLLGLVAHNQSGARAVYFGLHFTNTMLLLATLALTAHFLSRRLGFMRGSTEFRAPLLASVGLLATLATGVMGSLAALGDTLYPARDLWAAIAEDFSSHSSWLLRIRWIHPALAFVAGAFLLWLIIRNLPGGNAPGNRSLALVLLGLLALQYTLGFTDVALLAPVWLQLAHLFVADLLWITLVVLAVRTSIVPIGCTFGTCGFRSKKTAE
ncbi:COX15/CtaA family protein [Paracidobacterium acidisoli]|uniref:Cytochrome oxidase assembly protein n=1 Tax=Paracidobacterium acidisoli TaxID=2303751 RepID=A0A372IPL6_9BACT|nr:COX15/CtaA family protein [Paracidobacterium acidisoli]MBT9331224.1 COX15/CtaA family protein [Paracidobacterium acidisoli]